MKKYKVGAINWVLVSGKTNTILALGFEKRHSGTSRLVS